MAQKKEEEERKLKKKLENKRKRKEKQLEKEKKDKERKKLKQQKKRANKKKSKKSENGLLKTVKKHKLAPRQSRSAYNFFLQEFFKKEHNREKIEWNSQMLEKRLKEVIEQAKRGEVKNEEVKEVSFWSRRENWLRRYMRRLNCWARSTSSI